MPQTLPAHGASDELAPCGPRPDWGCVVGLPRAARENAVGPQAKPSSELASPSALNEHGLKPGERVFTRRDDRVLVGKFLRPQDGRQRSADQSRFDHESCATAIALEARFVLARDTAWQYGGIADPQLEDTITLDEESYLIVEIVSQDNTQTLVRSERIARMPWVHSKAA